MSTLRQSLETYLSIRRSLGAQLHKSGSHLHRFVDFMDKEGATIITRELALRWATAATSATPATWASRLADLRRFAAWLSATEPQTEVPPLGMLPHSYHRRSPYIYHDDEIERIMYAAARLPSHSGLRSETCTALFGLLATTGLRLGEAVGLNRDDVDLHSAVLAIRRAKFGSSRFVPMHDSTCVALKRYAHQRDDVFPRTPSEAFFLSERGLRLTHNRAQHDFAVVSRAAGIREPAPGQRRGHGPRLHDMRHRLAVKTLIRWYREGRNVEALLPRLSTYLGHVHVADTYWYIEAVPELLQLATERATASREVKP